MNCWKNIMNCKVSNSIKNGFDSEPVDNEKYLKTKIKSYEGKINTSFHSEKVLKKKISIYLSISNFDRLCFYKLLSSSFF